MRILDAPLSDVGMIERMINELQDTAVVIRLVPDIFGFRPERPVFVEQLKREVSRYRQKHMVKVGITGWAQVNGWRGDTDMHQRIEHDLYEAFFTSTRACRAMAIPPLLRVFSTTRTSR
jgi:hypothetical protein